MKLNKEYIVHPYIVEAEKCIRDNSGSSKSFVTLKLLPKSPSILLNFQRIKICREIINKTKETNPYQLFVRESAQILNNYELEFNSDKIPFLVVNHKDIWQKWLELVDILSSKYTGNQIDQDLSYMTSILGDDKKFLSILVKDYPMHELYGRELHKIQFDKENNCQRDWLENVFSEKLLFSQTYKLKITNTKDTLQIIGLANLTKNEDAIRRICSQTDIDISHISCIEQDTTYLGYNIAKIPDCIESKFSIRGKKGLLKEETIRLLIKRI